MGRNWTKLTICVSVCVSRWHALCSLLCCTSSCSLYFAGCVLRLLSSMCCWLRCSRVRPHAGSTTTSLPMAFLHWWWPFQPPSTTPATPAPPGNAFLLLCVSLHLRVCVNPNKHNKAHLCVFKHVLLHSCWLRVDNYFIWLFIGPVSLVILVSYSEPAA